MRGFRWLMASLALASPMAAVAHRQADDASRRELQRRIDANPDDPVTIANLARLYARADKPAKARSLYRGLLTLENVALEREGGEPVWSHALARNALKTLDQRAPVRLGSR